MAKQNIFVPELGLEGGVEVVELPISIGSEVGEGDVLAVVESDKASLEIPAEMAGKIMAIHIAIGDKIKSGDALVDIETSGAVAAAPSAPEVKPEPEVKPQTQPEPKPQPEAKPAPDALKTLREQQSGVYAGPAVRRQARELGVDLNQVAGSGNNGRILKIDVDNYVKARLKNPLVASSISASIDFSQFGEIEKQRLNGVKRATAKAMSAAWVSVPQVTHFEHADITELEAFRQKYNSRLKEGGVKLSLVPIVLKVLARALVEFPNFNASLDSDQETLILKKYCHLGVAVDTPKGLLVPVVRDVGSLSITAIAQEVARLAATARAGKLAPTDMQGGSFSLSSLGGVGGTAFTPIVNAPEVAILGLSRASLQPIYQNGELKPRLMLPLSLSYDHRVIDGAEAARFALRCSQLLSDIRELLL